MVHYPLERGKTPTKKFTILIPSVLTPFISRTLHSSRPNPAIGHNGALPEIEIDPNEPRYCYCNQVSFGDMVACDGENVRVFYRIHILIIWDTNPKFY